MTEQIKHAVDELCRRGFWGSLELEIRDGEITLIRKSETIKLDEGKNRREYSSR